MQSKCGGTTKHMRIFYTTIALIIITTSLISHNPIFNNTICLTDYVNIHTENPT